MTAPATLLRLMWLASPALPVGGFSYSEGLEAALDAGRVQGEAAVGDWLLDQLHLSLARADLPACAQAFQAWQAPPDAARLQALNDWVLATRESAEFRLQTEQMGRSLVEWLRNGEHAGDPRIARCAALQGRLLDLAVDLLKPGGVRVYATCTFAVQVADGPFAPPTPINCHPCAFAVFETT
jgi:urease accessory protein